MLERDVDFFHWLVAYKESAPSVIGLSSSTKVGLCESVSTQRAINDWFARSDGSP